MGNSKKNFCKADKLQTGNKSIKKCLSAKITKKRMKEEADIFRKREMKIQLIQDKILKANLTYSQNKI